MSDNKIEYTEEELSALGLLNEPDTDPTLPQSNTADKDVYHGADAITKVSENLGRPLTYAEQRVVAEEGYRATPYLDTKGVTTQGVGQTGEWIEKGFDAAFQHHVERARNRIPTLDNLPEDLKAEIIQAEYRGDLGTSPKFVGFMNEGSYEEASQEFLRNDDYEKSIKEGTGVHKRMKRVANAVGSYAGQSFLTDPSKTEVVPEATTGTFDYSIGNSGWSFIDGDTIKDSATGDRVRLRDIDLAETSKVLKEKGYVVGEGAGQVSKDMVSALANKYGYTTVKASKEKDRYGRAIGDLVDEDGRSFTDFLISGGIARPTFIGNSRETLSDDSYSRSLYGDGLRALRKDIVPKTDYEFAAELIKVAGLSPTNGVPIAKLQALNEQEYSAFPEIFSDVLIRNTNATLDNRSKTPLSDTWDSSLTMVGNSFKMVGAAMADVVGATDTRAWLTGQVEQSKTEMEGQAKVRLDYKDVNWGSIGEVGEFIGSNLVMSIPFMGVTMASMATAPLTLNASLTIPVAMYSGLILDEMPGNIQDKSYGVAVVGGAIAASLDRLGLRGALGGFNSQHFLTGESKQVAIDALMNATGDPLARAAATLGKEAGNAATVGLSKAQAEEVLTRLTKRELASYAKDAGEFASKQYAKGHILKELTKRLTAGAAFEGSTEMLQELTQYTAAVIGSEKTWDYEELESRLASALVAGGTLGGAFSVPTTVFKAGQWYDAGISKSDYDGRFDDATVGYKAEARAENKTKNNVDEVPDLDEVMQNAWDSANGNVDEGASAPDKARAKSRAQRLRDDPDASQRRTESAQGRKDAKTTRESLKDALTKPMVLLRTALDTRMNTELLNQSKTARVIYDMFGGRKNKTHGGVDFHTDKVINYINFENKLRPMQEVLASFKVKASRYGARKTQVSALVNSFYLEHIAPITRVNKDGSKRTNEEWMTGDQVIAAIDWDNLSNPNFTENSDSLKMLISELYTVDNTMYTDIVGRQKQAGNPNILGALQDHIFRSKGFLKEVIAKDKDEFVNLLVRHKRMDRDDAVSVTDAIIDNPEINTLDEAFDLTRGGLYPKGHKRRSLDISDTPAFDKFLEQDIFNNLEYSMKSSARYMTTTKFLGKNNMLVTSMLNDVYNEIRGDAEVGSPAELNARETVEDLTLALGDLINADSGNYKRIQSDAVRGAQKFLTLTGVLTMLPLAAISSTVELALTVKGSSLQNLHKNVGSFGLLLGREMFEYFAEVGRITGVTPTRSNFDTQIKSRSDRQSADPRFVGIDDPRGNLSRGGFLSQKTGAAVLVGVSETNQMTQAIMDSFFKIIGLQGITNLTRSIRSSMYNDFLIENLDVLHNSQGTITNEAAEARKMLEYMGIPVDKMLNLSSRLLENKQVDIESLGPRELAFFKQQQAELQVEWERQFDNGFISYVNASVPMPTAMGRPLFYSDPHLALFTQFQGFISQFTANHIPALWDTVKNATPGMKYSAFASIMTMLMLGYASQHLKDLIKFGEGSPYLSDEEKYLRALYSTGLLGTTERIISSDLLFPLYENRSDSALGSMWNIVSGEAPASNIVKNVYGFGQGILEDDARKTLKSSAGLTPFSFLKHRMYDTAVDNGWITGE